MESKENSQEEKKGGRKILIALVILVILILLGINVYLLRLMRSSDDRAAVEETNEFRNVLVNEENMMDILSETVSPGIPANFLVTMNAAWNFPNGSSPSTNAYVENASPNTTPVFFDVVRNDTGETIYKSPILEVGAILNSITLDTELPRGSYDCVVTYHLVDDEQNTLTTVDVALTINVET